jgi:MinD-like ATPase involved in chromosome partitioning or flagellar assembly
VVIAGWSTKGGSGTTVTCTAIALALMRPDQTGVIIDLGGEHSGDVGSLVGCSTQPRSGLTDWLIADTTVPPSALAELLQDRVQPRVLSVGHHRADITNPSAEQSIETTQRLQDALHWLVDTYGFVVLDLGSHTDWLADTASSLADASLLILRPCSLSVRASVNSTRRVVGAVIVGDGSRSLLQADIEGLLGVPVLTHIKSHPAIADAVDSGRFSKGVPREMKRSIGTLIRVLTGDRVAV